MLSDPITCVKCGHKEQKDFLESCPACGSENLVYPTPSDEELIATFTVAPGQPMPCPLDDGKETRDGRGSLLLPGDEVRLYDRIRARIDRIIMPQGWLIVRLIEPAQPFPDYFSKQHYQISSGLVFAVTPRIETPKPVQRVPIDEPRAVVGSFRRRFNALVRRWQGLR